MEKKSIIWSFRNKNLNRKFHLSDPKKIFVGPLRIVFQKSEQLSFRHTFKAYLFKKLLKSEII